jgi:hypothetical protein
MRAFVKKCATLLSIYSVSVFLAGCAVDHGLLKYGYLPGGDYVYYQPLKKINLNGKAVEFAVSDRREQTHQLECSNMVIHRDSELEGETGLSFFKNYLRAMTEYSSGKVDPSGEKIMVELEAISPVMSGFGYVRVFGVVQFSVTSGSINKRYCSVMGDGDPDAPFGKSAVTTRRNAMRKMVSASARRAVEQFMSDLENAGRGDQPAYGMPEFPQRDLGAFYDKLSPAHKEQLIRECLKEKYVSGVSYPYEYVFHHQYTLVEKDGSMVDYSDYAIRVNTADALRTMGEQIFSFDASKETVEILKASVYSSDGHEINTEITSAREKEPYTGLVYRDLKVKTISLKGLQEGSILRVVIKRTDRPDGRKYPIFKQVGLTNYIPSKERVYILRFQTGTEYIRKERIRREALGSIVAEDHVAANGDSIYIYGCMGGRTEIREAGGIPVQEFDDRVFFFAPTTWDEVARRYYSLSNPKVAVTEEISQKARQISGDSPERDGKVRAIYDYVKGIRYVAILLNQYEVVPHDASLTLRNGYGDCKDKSVLLMAMLKAIGIDSSISLVNTSHLVDEDLPSLSAFNHAVVAIRGTNDSYSFLDATNPFTPYGLLPPGIQNRHALIVGEKGGELVLIPPQAPNQNRVEESIEVEFDDVESATIRSRSLTFSSNEIFHALPNLPRNVLRQGLQQLLSAKYKEVDIVDFKCEPADKQGVLLTETQLKIGDFTKRVGNAYVFNPLVDADSIWNHDVIALSARKTDIELEGPKRLVADVTIRLTNSVAVEFLPKAKSFSNAKFGEYSYQVRQTGEIIRIHRELLLRAKRVSVKDYEEFRQFYRECIRQEEEMVLLIKR